MTKLSQPRGSSLAFFAAFMAVVIVPLMSLTIDIPRLMTARTRLTAAVQSGCEALSNSVDLKEFETTGQVKLLPGAEGDASAAFYGTAPAGASFSGGPVDTATGSNAALNFWCEATAQLQPLIPLSPPLTLHVTTHAEGRYATAP